MMHHQSMAHFGGDYSGIACPVPEHWRAAGEPGDRCDDSAADLTAPHQMTKPVLNKYAVIRSLVIRIERRKCQKPQGHAEMARGCALRPAARTMRINGCSIQRDMRMPPTMPAPAKSGKLAECGAQRSSPASNHACQ